MTLGLVMALALPAVGQASAAADDPTLPGTRASTAKASEGVELDRQVAFRASVGLRSDAIYVERVAGDPENFPDQSWGVPLSVAEAADLDGRVVVQRMVRGAIEWADDQGTYAGMYFDQLRDGIPVFLFTGELDHRLNDLRERIAETVTFEVGLASESLRSLQNDKRNVTEHVADLRRSGIYVTSSGVHVSQNRVEVAVAELTDAAIAAIRDIAPKAVVFQAAPGVADACALDGTGCTRPMIAGLAIQAPIAGTSAQGCTAGYLGKRTDHGHADIVVVTAGHCITYPGAGANPHSATWELNDGRNIGTQQSPTLTGWHANSLGDIGYITLSGGWEAAVNGALNDVLARPDASPPVTKRVTSTLSWGSQTEGTMVCRLGLGSFLLGHGRDCGPITKFDTDTTPTVADNRSCAPNNAGTCYIISNMKAVAFDSTNGDSGGTMIVKEASSSTVVELLGTHVHSVPDGPPPVPIGPSNNEMGWYTTWDYGLIELSLSDRGSIQIAPCLSATCT